MGVLNLMKGVETMNVRKNIDYSEMYKELDMLMAKELPQMELMGSLSTYVHVNRNFSLPSSLK